MPTTTQPPTTMPTTTQPTTTQPLTTQPTTTLPPTTQAPTTLNPADYPQLFNPSNPDVYVFEAEAGQITGTPSYGEVFIENIEAASGGQTVGYFATLGNKITWNINATENVTVAIDLVMSSSLMRQTDYVVINQPINPSTFGVKVNGVAISYPEYIVPGSNEAWVFNSVWGDFVISGINLVKGANTIEIEVLNTNAAPNMDVLKIKSAQQLTTGSGGPTEPQENYEGDISYSLVIEGYEWGPSVSKIVLHFEDHQIGKNTFDKDTFKVLAGSTARNVLAAYLSDAQGKEIVDDNSNYVTLAFEVGYSRYQPIHNSSVFSYTGGRNVFRNLAIYSVSLQTGKSLVINSVEYKQVNVASSKYSGRISPDTDGLLKGSFSDGSRTLTYAAYETEAMKNDSGKNPLIIWLHGAGEGGIDVDIAILGNEATALFKDPIQSYFRTELLQGAYVLVVQTPTAWMDSGSGQHSGNEPSIYTALLMATIEHYTGLNSDVDKNRIYIGGCSNGGYMTMNMIIEYPNYFAAAYPICEAYMNSYVDETKLNKIKDLPIWFITAANDTTVSPANFTVATYVRLIQAGAENVHFSYFSTVIGKDQPGANYFGHWSWIYAFNDEVSLDQNKAAVFTNGASAVSAPSTVQVLVGETPVNLWQWLASRKLPEVPQE
jgi:predicted peptidase